MYHSKPEPILNWDILELDTAEGQESVLVETYARKTSEVDRDFYKDLQEFMKEPRSRAQLQKFCKISSREYFRTKILNPLINAGKVQLTIPDKPTSSKQKYVWNEK